MAEGRSVWRLIWANFKKSLRLLPPKGKFIGKDPLGNEYYEAPLNSHSYKKAASRWFKPLKEDNWQQNLPPEWEAWLRGRRKDPPTEEEIVNNMSVADMKKIKGDEIEAKYKKGTPEIEKSIKGFPKYKDYEDEPGSIDNRKNSK